MEKEISGVGNRWLGVTGWVSEWQHSPDEYSFSLVAVTLVVDHRVPATQTHTDKDMWEHDSLTHSLIHSFIHSFTHSLTHSPHYFFRNGTIEMWIPQFGSSGRIRHYCTVVVSKLWATNTHAITHSHTHSRRSHTHSLCLHLRSLHLNNTTNQGKTTSFQGLPYRLNPPHKGLTISKKRPSTHLFHLYFQKKHIHQCFYVPNPGLISLHNNNISPRNQTQWTATKEQNMKKIITSEETLTARAN